MMDRKYDQWRFITIHTEIKTYDIIVEERQDALDIITAVSEALIRQIKYNHDKKLKR